VIADGTLAEIAVPDTIEETGVEDSTTMDFVVHILITLFKKDRTTAVGLMLEVHHKGSAVVDILPLEEAELRQHQVHDVARHAGFPLRCVIEPA